MTLASLGNPSSFALAAGAPLSPLVILVICAITGIGTVLLLPGNREASIRKIGTMVLLAGAGIFVALLVRMAAGDAKGGMGAYFWIFSVIALAAAVRVVTHTRPVYSALYFVLTVFATAGLFLLLWAEFMAAALVLIYAGAILVTYVFVIMLATEASSTGGEAILEHDQVAREPVLSCAVGFALLGMLLFVIFDKYQTIEPVAQSSAGVVSGPTQELGEYLFRSHLVNLELAGLILTIAMIGAIVIARRKVVGEKQLDTGEVVLGPATPVDDNPHSIPVLGTRNPAQKAYPET